MDYLIGLVKQPELEISTSSNQKFTKNIAFVRSEEKIRIDGTKCVAGMERGGAGKGMMLTQVRSQE